MEAQVKLNKQKSLQLEQDVQEFLAKRGLKKPTQLKMGVSLVHETNLTSEEKEALRLESLRREKEIEAEIKQKREAERLQKIKDAEEKRLLKNKQVEEKRKLKALKQKHRQQEINKAQEKKKFSEIAKAEKLKQLAKIEAEKKLSLEAKEKLKAEKKALQENLKLEKSKIKLERENKKAQLLALKQQRKLARKKKSLERIEKLKANRSKIKAPKTKVAKTIEPKKPKLILKKFKARKTETLISDINMLLKNGAISRGESKFKGECLKHGKSDYEIQRGIARCSQCRNELRVRTMELNKTRSHASKGLKEKQENILSFNQKQLVQALKDGKERFTGKCKIHGETEFFARKFKIAKLGYASCCLLCRTDAVDFVKTNNLYRNRVTGITHAEYTLYYRERIDRYKDVHKNANDRGLNRTTFFCQHHGIQKFHVYEKRMICVECLHSTKSRATNNSLFCEEMFARNRARALEALKNDKWSFIGECEKHGSGVEKSIAKGAYLKSGHIKASCLECKSENNRRAYFVSKKKNLSKKETIYLKALYTKYKTPFRKEVISNLDITTNQFKNYVHGLNAIPEKFYLRLIEFAQERGYTTYAQ